MLLLMVTLSATALEDELTARMRNANSEAEALGLIQEFLPRMRDIAEWRTLQNYWMRLDPNACRDWFADQHAQYPDSPIYTYLWLRNMEDQQAQLAGARDLIGKNPDFYWAYRIFFSTFAQIHNSLADGEELPEAMRPFVQSDLQLLLDARLRFPLDDYLHLALYHHYNTAREFSTAESYLLKLSDANAVEANFRLITDFCRRSRSTRAFEKLFPLMLHNNIKRGQITSMDSSSVYSNNYFNLLDSMQMWERMEAWLKSNPSANTASATLYARINLNIAKERFDAALALVQAALADGSFHISDIAEDERYLPMRDYAPWKKFVADAQAAYVAAKPQRREAALAKKVSGKAPLWELPDPKDRIYRLADFKGRNVVLHFWATWCNPCLTTMPLLDKWTRDSKPRNTDVFSINIWESNHAEAMKMMLSGRYAMMPLVGNDDMSVQYGFSGIPYIVVIDRQGNLAYADSGYSPDLPETLDFWLEELNKQE